MQRAAVRLAATAVPDLSGSDCNVTDSGRSSKVGIHIRFVLCNTVKVGRRQGRQSKRGEDNSREWTGLEFAKSKRAVENGEKWRKLVVKSSAVPQRPPPVKE